MSDWPDFMPLLLPRPSASPLAAVLPPAASGPDQDSIDPADDTSTWTGLWKGWGSRDFAVDLLLRIGVGPSGNPVLDAAAAHADGAEQALSLDARFDDEGELVALWHDGRTLRLRRRDIDTIELMLGTPDEDWMCGVLGRWDETIEHRVERIPTPFVEDGRAVELNALVYRPRGDGPFPTLLFNHGSTGNGRDPSLFAYPFASLPLVRFFVTRGWMIVFPQRRGRGGSDGTYGEGLAADGSGYLTDPDGARTGFERALEDIDAAATWLERQPDVDPDCRVIGGQSRGGILSIAWVGTRPRVFRAAIDFVGGWLNGRMKHAAVINPELFARGAPFDGPTLWLHATTDSLYTIEHSRSCFDAFVAAGGTGRFHALELPPAHDGHQAVYVPEHWEAIVDEFLNDLVR